MIGMMIGFRIKKVRTNIPSMIAATMPRFISL